MLLEILKGWLEDVWHKLKKDPIQSIISLFLCVFLVPVLSKVIIQSFGVLTFIGYIFACIYGLTKLIDDPRRSIVWSIGFIVCATAVKLIFDSVIPIAKGKDMVSIFSALVMLYVIGALYFKGKELKGV